MKARKLVLISLFAVIVVAALFYQEIIARVLLPQYIEWARETDQKGLNDGVPLNEKERLLASEIGIKHPEKVRIIYVDQVPYPYENFALKVFGEAVGLVGEGIINNAQVFGYSIYARKDFVLNKPKLAHELVHVLQIERTSLDDIVTQHFFDMAEYGYDKAPLEVEAVKANEKYSTDW
ncbi:hypothetical protein [Alteromonas sp. KUL106]|uniref:hypothetical protein n=1 Tax=Alteromonas sp. KUL106 TaxID=2480799 RepID=UPI0012E4C2BD|nr:hypothetical protein [Alteromonas sp. KUL106]GFD68401.1 hypothetical protein KUL106_16640 [Alteromonas sp. KUL106]GFD80922.1 hypothetical protein KUL118_37840 [Tenacibaculum sp. KUL118]